jgi:hypothetical protein
MDAGEQSLDTEIETVWDKATATLRLDNPDEKEVAFLVASLRL